MVLGQILALMIVNKCVKFEHNSFNSIEVMGKNQFFPKSVKGHNFVQMPDTVMALGKIVSLVMVNKCLKFEQSSFNCMEVMGKVKVFHDNADDDAYAVDDDDTGVMTIPRLFFFEKPAEVKKTFPFSFSKRRVFIYKLRSNIRRNCSAPNSQSF